MLLHAPSEWNIILFSVATQRMEQEDRILVSHVKQAATSVGHEQGVAVVHRVPQLEGKHRVCATPLKLVAELGRGETEPVQPVVVLDRLYDLKVTADQPVSGTTDGLLSIGKATCCGAPSPCYSFFFIVLVYLNATLAKTA